jgi:diguanylate cyclase (GGDEF)-like protein
LLEEGQKLIDSSLAKGENGIICFGDMDKLKYINDTFGHEMGDAAIKGMGVVLQEVIGKDKVIGRLGGDEFAFVMNNFDLENFASLKEDVNKLCKKYSKQKKFPFEIQVSLGAVQYSEGHKNLSRLITKADKEQYKDKQSKNVQRKA